MTPALTFRSAFALFAGTAVLSGALVLSTTAGAAAAPQSTPPTDPRTILDRVFSVAQADRGEQRFKQSCSSCHSATDFAGSGFSGRWEGQTLGDLYSYISSAMPENDPGSLQPGDYVNVIAFFLGQNGYPVGYDDLPVDTAVLKQIGIVPNPK